MTRFSILGRLELVRDDGSPVQPVLAQPKRTALLAYLALRAGRGVSRDLLVETFWPELAPERGRAALRKGLHFLRQALGPEAIVTVGGQVAAPPSALWCDAVAFDAAVAAGEAEVAAELYRGELLPGVSVAGAPDWDIWVDGERARLRRLASDAAAAGFRRAESSGRVEDAWNYLDAGLRIDPADDAAVHRLLSYAMRSGAARRGLRLYEEHCARLAAEWEMEPSAECRRLATALAGTLPAGDAGHPEPAPPVTGASRSTAQVASADLATNAAAATPGEFAGHARTPQPRVQRWLATVAILLLAALLTPLVFRLPGAGGAANSAIAVGAVRDLTASDSAAASAIPELLATNLGRVRGLELISPMRLLELADTALPWPRAVHDAARRAGARQLVEGALLRHNGGLRLDLRRVDPVTGEVRATYSFQHDDVFALVDAATAALLDDLVGNAPDLRVTDVASSSLVALRFYQEGLRLYLHGSAADARPLFAAALDEDSTFAMAAYYLAVTATNFDEAMLERAARLAERQPERERLLIRSMWLQHMDDPQRLAVAESLVVRHPREPEGYMALGRAQFWGGDFAAARRTLIRVIAMDSAAPPRRQPCLTCETYFDLSSLYLHMDSGAAAEGVARRYLERHPESDRGYDMLINALEHQGRYQEMEAAVERFAALSGDEDAAYDRRAAAAIRRGHFTVADSLLTSRQPLRDNARARQLWYRIISLRNQRRFDEALELVEQYHRLVSNDDDLIIGLVLRGIVLHEAGDYARAAALFEEAAARPSGQVASRQARHRAWNLTHAATSRAALGDTAWLRAFADTVQQLGARSAYGRDTRLHHHIRGLDAALRGDTTRAIQHLRAAVFSPTHGFTRTNLELGRLLNASGRHAEAAAILEAALRGTLSSSQLYVTHADLHEQLFVARASLRQSPLAREHQDWLRRARGTGARSAEWRRDQELVHHAGRP